MSAEEAVMRAPDASFVRQRGFSLVEVLVSLALLVVVMTAFLTLLDSSARVSKTQSSIAGMTENLRFTVDEMVRMVRMAGTGGVPLLAPGTGGALNILAVTVTDNVAAGAVTYGTGANARTALAGTDVLMLRGVIGGELYDIRGTLALSTLDSGDHYTLEIPPVSPYTGRAQNLVVPEQHTPIIFTTTWELPVPLASGVTRYFSKYNIGLTDSGSINGSGNLEVVFRTVEGDGPNDAAILVLNEGGDFQPFQEEFVITAGFLDDLVFFIAANDSGEPSMFMFTPADDTVSELVPNVASLQVALGCDLNGDGQLTEDGTNSDEWFYNVSGDTAPTAAQVAMLQEVRVSVVARGESREHAFSETIELPENAPAYTDVGRGDDLNFRQRAITVHVTVRSHPPVAQG